MPLTVRRTPRTRKGYIEPLDLADAIPLWMMQIPGGVFTMGSPDNEPGRDDDEGPQREVAVPDFFMGRYPVTQAQWRAVAALPAEGRSLDPDPSRFKGENRPVEKVSWEDAVEFCARLSRLAESRLAKHTKRPYRLPGEAEWEYACRAGTQTPFYFGKTLTTDVANYCGQYTYDGGPNGKYRGETTPVDHFGIANAFGLSDMHGNVYEWCQDYWHENYEGAPTDGSAWIEGGDSSIRIVRGGSWLYDPRSCRSSNRFRYDADYRNYVTGFRVCCSAPRTG
ncbi:MAG: formylglycine-generating enzyme family protein [Synechococcales bacterium]|nr:formylglycine-generating enzyme family protein [Synechococcales bacterium]